MKILVVGGAGYIGAHMCRTLQDAGTEFAVLDDFSTGHESAVEGFRIYRGSLCSADFVNNAIGEYKPELIMHFAAKSLVGESVENPAIYYRQNILGMLNLLDAMRANDIGKLVFSSTAAVYGMPRYSPIDEEHPLNPVNPYGRTKLHIENMLQDYGDAYGLQSISLRYFNAAGAHHSGDCGEDHEPETHLIPNIIKAALCGTAVELYGNDYPTEDGFCIRDYIHVEDLCHAHLLAAGYFDELQAGQFECFNLGTEYGASVRQVLEVCKDILGKDIDFTIAQRRPGDPDTLVASAHKARNLLGWQPQHDLNSIISSAIQWHKAQAS